MECLSKKMKEYWMSKGLEEKQYEDMLTCTVNIAMAISIYAHREQRRENGISYSEHPYSCMNLYRDFVGIEEDSYDCIDLDLMYKHNIPFEGVQEVALLHDVLEDTEVVLDEIEEMFNDFGYATYFELYIKQALILITHDKSESYEIYIDRMLVNPVASICKMMDLTDNMNMLGLASLKDSELDRTIRYAKYFKQINDKWHFIENMMLYKKERANLQFLDRLKELCSNDVSIEERSKEE
jgi:(p)ppGpp synthase/HD superfamily hydrolase